MTTLCPSGFLEFSCTKTITLLVGVKSDLRLSNFAIKRLSRRPNSETTRDLSLKASWQLSAAAAADNDDEDNDNNNTSQYVDVVLLLLFR